VLIIALEAQVISNRALAEAFAMYPLNTESQRVAYVYRTAAEKLEKRIETIKKQSFIK
jgi:hypothetical protein